MQAEGELESEGEDNISGGEIEGEKQISDEGQKPEGEL